MEIKFISDCVEGEMPLDELEIVCVPKKKHAQVDLCIKSNMNISFAKIKLFDTDRWVDAEKLFEAATALGNEIANAFNNRIRKGGSMHKDELITKQQLEIEVLKKRLKWAKKDKADIAMTLVCIGGPLNDNILGYSKEQRRPLHEILELAECGDHEHVDEET